MDFHDTDSDAFSSAEFKMTIFDNTYCPSRQRSLWSLRTGKLACTERSEDFKKQCLQQMYQIKTKDNSSRLKNTNI